MKFTIASLISIGFACTVAITAPMSAFAQEKAPEQPLNYFGVGASNRGAAFESKLSINNRFQYVPQQQPSFLKKAAVMRQYTYL
ncbi:MAG: hypothetical protein HC815_38310 [Richelia sp. RM1_1_1]|nr:hypothetical protein [Richelia sp. RM1_1_1]